MLVRQRLLSWMQNSPDQVLAEMEWSQERGTAEAPDQPASHHLPSVPPTSGAWARAGAPRPRRAILQALPELGLGRPGSAPLPPHCRPASPHRGKSSGPAHCTLVSTFIPRTWMTEVRQVI